MQLDDDSDRDLANVNEWKIIFDPYIDNTDKQHFKLLKNSYKFWFYHVVSSQWNGFDLLVLVNP